MRWRLSWKTTSWRCTWRISAGDSWPPTTYLPTPYLPAYTYLHSYLPTPYYSSPLPRVPPFSRHPSPLPLPLLFPPHPRLSSRTLWRLKELNGTDGAFEGGRDGGREEDLLSQPGSALRPFHSTTPHNIPPPRSPSPSPLLVLPQYFPSEADQQHLYTGRVHSPIPPPYLRRLFLQLVLVTWRHCRPRCALLRVHPGLASKKLTFLKIRGVLYKNSRTSHGHPGVGVRI